jgi:digeranylgeranylglycerophospholipid reductase
LALADIESCAQFLVHDPSIDDDYTEFFLGNNIAPSGYAWSFPKGEKLANIGLGIQGSRSKPGEAVRLLRQLMKSRFPNGKIVEMVVGGDPCSGPIKSATANGVMLVGDAAHQTDPLTGGGILNAMRAGVIAGDVAAKAASAGDFSRKGLSEYESRWREDIGKTIERSFQFKEFFVKLTDKDINQLIGSLAKEDISKMDLGGMLRVLFRLNPRLLWSLKSLII